MDKRIYTIQINGIEASIKQVDALTDSLQFLDKKIKELDERNVSINSDSSGGNGGARTSQLQSQDKLLKQLKQSEQEIIDVQKEEYQQLLANKELSAKLKDAAKERASAERLYVNEYANTMEGLKQELADIKKVMNTTDLGSDKFKELTTRANELTNKLKEIEESYGQFGRNVGNYKSAFDGMKKVSVTVGGVVREFNSARDASRQLTQELKGMVIAGKEDTQEYKDLAEALHEFEMASKRAESAVNDLKASSKGMDDILDTFQSLAYLAQTTQGISALFGLDNTSIERSIQKLVAFQNALEGIEKLRLKLTANDAGFLGSLFTKGNAGIDAFVAKITGAKKGIDGLSMATKRGTIAVRGLSVALKGIGIGLIVGAITLAISAFERLSTHLDTTKLKIDDLNRSENDLNAAYKERRDLMTSDFLNGTINSEQLLANQYENETMYISKQIDLLRERASLINKQSFLDYINPWAKDKGDFTGKHLEGETTIGSGHLISLDTDDLQITVNNIEELENAWDKCNQAILEGKDYFDKWGSGLMDWASSLFTTVKDTEEVMYGLGRVRLSELVASFYDLNDSFKNGKVTAEEYAKGLNKLVKEMNNNKVVSSTIANLPQYIQDEEVRSKIENIISSLRRLDNEFNMTSPEQIRYWQQVRIEGMKEGLEKTKAQLKAEEDYEITQHGKTEEQIELIRAKYRRKNKEAEEKDLKERTEKYKKHAKDIEAAERELNSLRIQNMAEGLQKQIAQLNEERRQKIAKAKENGIKAGEIEAETNKLYDKKILDAKEKWAYDIEQVYINMWNKIYQINHQNAQMDYENQMRDLGNEYKRLQDEAARAAGSSTQEYSDRGTEIVKKPKKKSKANSEDPSDFNYKVLIEKEVDYTKRLNEEFKTRTEQRNKYYAEVEKLALEKANKEYKAQNEIANENKNNELRNLKNSYKAQDKEFENHLKAGQITLKQYNEAIERLNKERGIQEAEITTKYQTEAEERERNHQEKIYDAVNETNNSILSNYSEMFEKLNSIDTSEPIINKLGLLDVSGTMERNKLLINSFKNLSDKIKIEINKLESELKKNDITAEQKKKIEELISKYKELQKAITGTNQQISEDTDKVIPELVARIDQYVQVVGETISSVLDAVWTAQDAAYEREKERLEEQLDFVRDKYDKMSELADEYSSRIKESEGLIATAQGDARDALLDRYNVELQAERRAIMEKKKAAKEEEKLKAKADKLDKEQREKQKQRDIIQALINTSMAISMASVNAWPMPAIAMMAAAAVAGAAQVAAIASQHYATGGVIEGKSHAHGGVKVLGGRAEVEGGEFITNKVTTAKNVDLLEFINSKKKRVNISDLIEFFGGDSVKNNIRTVRTKFADGGIVPTLRNDITINDRMIKAIEDYSNRPQVVQVVDIIDRMDNVRQTQVLAGLNPEY